ncbi:transposase [Streptomyces sp. NPDC007074]|uniref:transposase n=1 Tax=Streptomyces sp. NPDC007074 TaxID=3156764 RepID=UPI0033E96A26
MTKVWADGGYQNSVFRHGEIRGIDGEAMKRATGFRPQKRRWVIERTLGWLMQNRRLVRDYETLPQYSRTMIHWAIASKISREFTGASITNLANRNRRFG